MAFIPVVAAHGQVGQAGVTWEVDAVSIGVQLSGTAATAGVDDVTRQHRHDAVQWRGAVTHHPWCILGRLRMLEAKGNQLDSEFYGPYERTREKGWEGIGGRAPPGSRQTF